MNARAKPSGSISATPTVLSARRFQAISPRRGDQGLAADPIKAYFSGTADQSFGVWNAGGVELYLTGDANDYVGKGMAGGLIAILVLRLVPPSAAMKRALSATPACMARPVVVCMPQAARSERFGVRNSGAITVVEALATTAVNI